MKNYKPKASLLPIGISDLLEKSAYKDSYLTENLMNCFILNGYDKVSPPLIEFEENYTLFLDTTNNQNIFRVIDPISNKSMFIRNDITPQIARIAASKLNKTNDVLRLSYAGDILRPKGNQLHPSRQLKQAGIELFGAPSVEGAVEVISVGIQALNQVNISNLIIDITTPNIANLIMKNNKLDEQTIEKAKSYLKVKNINKIKTIPKCGSVLSQIADSAGEEERALEKLSKIDLPKKAKILIEEISLICSAIKKIHKDIKITIDPIENRGFNYYSGIGFAIFSSNIKRELGFGGEYVLEVNDNKYKGMGLSILFDGLLKTTNINNKQKRIFVPLNHDNTIPHELRKNGWITIFNYKKNVKEKEEALKFNCSHILKNNTIKEL